MTLLMLTDITGGLDISQGLFLQLFKIMDVRMKKKLIIRITINFFSKNDCYLMTGKSFYNINTVYKCTDEITAGHLYILYKMSGGI